jgi:hypothetical protein
MMECFSYRINNIEERNFRLSWHFSTLIDLNHAHLHIRDSNKDFTNIFLIFAFFNILMTKNKFFLIETLFSWSVLRKRNSLSHEVSSYSIKRFYIHSPFWRIIEILQCCKIDLKKISSRENYDVNNANIFNLLKP